MVTQIIEVNRLLIAFQIFLGQFQRRLGELHVDEQGGDLEGQGAFVVRHQVRGHGRLVLGGLKAVLAFFAALDQVAEAQIGLRQIVEIGTRIVAWRKQRQVIPIGEDCGVGAQIGGHFLRLALLDGGASRQQAVVVLERQANGIVQSDPDRALGECRAR